MVRSTDVSPTDVSDRGAARCEAAASPLEPANGGGGDKEFGTLLASAVSDVRRSARRFAYSSDDADDLTQTVMFKAWRARGQFVRGTNLGGWLYVILRNAVRSRQRLRRREQGWSDSFENLRAVPPSQDWSCELIDLRRALSRLPHHQYRALWLIVVEGKSLESVGQAEQVTPQAIKSRITRARRNLEKLMSGQGALLVDPESKPAIKAQAIRHEADENVSDAGSEVDREQVAILRAYLAERQRGDRPTRWPHPDRAAAWPITEGSDTPVSLGVQPAAM